MTRGCFSCFSRLWVHSPQLPQAFLVLQTLGQYKEIEHTGPWVCLAVPDLGTVIPGEVISFQSLKWEMVGEGQNPPLFLL